MMSKMKKIFLFVAFLSIILGASACYQQPTEVEHVDIFEIQSHITETISTVSSGCVAVISNNMDHQMLGNGSGVIYKKESIANSNKSLYYVITNNHVVADGVYFDIYMQSSIFSVTYEATLKGTDPDYDIAVLTFESEGDYHVSELKNDNNVLKGQFVIAIGTPLSLSYYNTTTLGIVSGFRGYYIQHDAAINPGNSGGALFDIDGRLIGINVAKRTMVYPNSSDNTAVEGVGFAINITTVIYCVTEIEAQNTEIHRPSLGITVTSFAGYRANYSETEGYTEAFIPSDMEEGVIVVSVRDGSVAQAAGVQNLDIILSLDGVSITNNSELRNVLWQHNIGDTVTMVVLRNLEEVTLTVVL